MGLKTQYSDFYKEYTLVKDYDSKTIKKFKENILKNKNLWADAEKAFGEYTENFVKEGLDIESFFECHEDFCLSLANYLKKQEQQLNYDKLKDTIAQNFAKSLKNTFSGFREVQRQQIEESLKNKPGGINYNFISFNYTQTIDNCVKAVKSKSGILGKRPYIHMSYENQANSVMHIHGYTYKNMVLGLNDETQIKNPLLFDNQEEEYLNQIIKIKTNIMNEENIDTKVHELLKESNLIYIYGMSIGETDTMWWERICHIMKSDTSLHLIIHKFDAPQDELLRRKIQLYAKKIRKEFTAFSDYDDDTKLEIESRIHIDCTNIFKDLHDLVNSDLNQKEKPRKEVATV